jgi:uncharacterized FAD-dependent dehydrogenase
MGGAAGRGKSRAAISPGTRAAYMRAMLRVTEIKLPLDHTDEALRAALAERLGVAAEALLDVSIFRRGYDARRAPAIEFVYTVDVSVRNEQALLRAPKVERAPDCAYRLPFRAPPHAPRPLVIGAGPCGLFATLVLAQMGFRPILLERGKAVRERTRDTWGLWRRGELNPGSNVQFGEGGAGTFSDGKLHSTVKDAEFRWRKVLTEFVAAGAPEEILYVSKPHIGTFRLVSMVEAMRATVEALGGEYRFGAEVTDLLLDPDRRVIGVRLQDGEEIAAPSVVLAPGHSARDLFALLAERGVAMAAKPFSIGVRIEHPQGLIDRARFGVTTRPKVLGAADYKLVAHGAAGRDVYSFCMCPGGTVVAAASEPGRVVTNGMSQYSRAERNANAGIVVAMTPERDYPGGALAGIELQRRWESMAFEAGGSDYAAPAQLLADFLARRPSRALGIVRPSYRPGVVPTDLGRCLPDFAVAAIREAIPRFAVQLRGFDLPDAVLTGVETRTSSPVRIERDGTLQSPNTPGLFPAGEGCGYAGGILSAGVDGIRAAEAVAASLVG